LSESSMALTQEAQVMPWMAMVAFANFAGAESATTLSESMFFVVLMCECG